MAKYLDLPTGEIALGLLTLSEATAAGQIIQQIGSATEGMHLVAVDVTVAPAAVETAVFTVPAGSVIVSSQATVKTALTGGGTTVTFSLGIAADPDKYGTATANLLTANAKLNFIPAYAFLASTEAIVLTGAAAGGATDGDTALTVGTVRCRIVYWTLNSLDN
jgi:hypothetical protein